MSTFASALKSDERVIFFPTFYCPAQTNQAIEIHGWVFEPGNHKLLTGLFRRALGIKESELSAEELATFRERCRYFLHDNERRKTLSIRLGGQTFQVGPSAPNGHFRTLLALSPAVVDNLKNASTSGKAGFELLAPGHPVQAPLAPIYLLAETGISVISDIDDTIKISYVWNKKELLRNTFCRPFQPVPGMAAAYQSWQKSAGAQFHYISAMPWQLYPYISESMRSNGFPVGTFQCRYFRVKDSSFWSLFRSPEQYKLQTIEGLLKQFPKRTFVLVGDSGEKDPEIYGAVARAYPKQVVRIFIRDVTNEAADSLRYKKAFADVPQEVWLVFKSAQEIRNKLTKHYPGTLSGH